MSINELAKGQAPSVVRRGTLEAFGVAVIASHSPVWLERRQARSVILAQSWTTDTKTSTQLVRKEPDL